MKTVSIRQFSTATDSRPSNRPSPKTRRVGRDPTSFATTILALVGLVLVAASAAAESGILGGEAAGGCPRCQKGVCYQEVVTYRCKQVPDNKPIKKTVYECREVPYCQHKLPGLLHGACCPECEACPKFKKVLVKKEIVVGETCGTKCVPEKFVERIPVPCCRCGYTPTGTPTVPPSDAAPTTPPTAATPSVTSGRVSGRRTAVGGVNDSAAASRRSTADAQQPQAHGQTPEAGPKTLESFTGPTSARRLTAAALAAESPRDLARQVSEIQLLNERLPTVDGSEPKSVRLSIREEATAFSVQPIEGKPIRLVPASAE